MAGSDGTTMTLVDSSIIATTPTSHRSRPTRCTMHVRCLFKLDPLLLTLYPDATHAGHDVKDMTLDEFAASLTVS
jgi:hypothetical protein